MTSLPAPVRRSGSKATYEAIAINCDADYSPKSPLMGSIRHSLGKTGLSLHAVLLTVLLVVAAVLVWLTMTAVHLSARDTALEAAGAPRPVVTTSTTTTTTSGSSMEALLASVLQQTVKLESLAQQVAALARANASTPAAPAPAAPAPAADSTRRSRHSKAAQNGVGTVHHVGTYAANANCRSRLKVPQKGLVAPVVIVAYERVHYLARSLMNVLSHWDAEPANHERFPLFVSIDGGMVNTTIFASALNFATGLQIIHHQRDEATCARSKNSVAQGYCHLSHHYRMLLQLFFECHKAPRLLFLEEDLSIAPDFFSYFTALAPVLDRDDSLWCVSAWNDNGQAGRASNATALMRTDVMPGLGWMLPARVASELIARWPDAYWDDFMREPDVSKGRQCVFPEVSRTTTFGKNGASRGENFKSHLASMRLNDVPVNWTQQDLSYLEPKTYENLTIGWLAAAQHISPNKAARYCRLGQPDDKNETDLVMFYEAPAVISKDYQRVAKALAPMTTDLKAGVPRASYDGTAMVRCRGRRLWLTPRDAFDQRRERKL